MVWYVPYHVWCNSQGFPRFWHTILTYSFQEFSQRTKEFGIPTVLPWKTESFKNDPLRKPHGVGSGQKNKKNINLNHAPGHPRFNLMVWIWLACTKRHVHKRVPCSPLQRPSPCEHFCPWWNCLRALPCMKMCCFSRVFAHSGKYLLYQHVPFASQISW